MPVKNLAYDLEWLHYLPNEVRAWLACLLAPSS